MRQCADCKDNARRYSAARPIARTPFLSGIARVPGRRRFSGVTVQFCRERGGMLCANLSRGDTVQCLFRDTTLHAVKNTMIDKLS
jgi:hypothetical protein